MYSRQRMANKKGAQLTIQDWNATPYFSLALARGEDRLAWHTVFVCECCHFLFSRWDVAQVLKEKPKTPGKQVVTAPPEIPMFCDSCTQQMKRSVEGMGE